MHLRILLNKFLDIRYKRDFVTKNLIHIHLITQKINDTLSNFNQNSSGQIKLHWSLYFLKEKSDLFDLNISYHFGTKFTHDIFHKKYFNFFFPNLTYYFINDGKNSAGIRYEYVRGENVIDDIEYDNYQKVLLTFKFVLFK